MTEKADINYEKSITNEICDRLCDRNLWSQNPWSENEFVTDSVTNCDAICDRKSGHILRPHFSPLNIWDLSCDSFRSEKFRLSCDRFCNHTIVVTDFVTESDQIICDRTCDRYHLWPLLWLTLLEIMLLCDRICDRFWKMKNNLWLLLWPILKNKE